jgi:F0F1-type ATP synthase assembly protein I
MTQEHRPDEKPPDQTKPGWIESLAQRSAGLPDTTPPLKKDRDQEKSLWSHAGAGIQFALTTALFAFMGLYVDRHWNTSPWAILGFTSLGFVGGLYLLIKDALKENAGPSKKAGKP